MNSYLITFSLFLCFFVSLFLCFFVSLFLCFFVSLFLCFFVVIINGMTLYKSVYCKNMFKLRVLLM